MRAGQRKNSHPATASLTLTLFLLFSFSQFVKPSFSEPLSSEWSPILCAAMSERHSCSWTGCEPSEWTSSSHGCGPSSFLCGDPSGCPGGWQYKCCLVPPEGTLSLNLNGRIGKRALMRKILDPKVANPKTYPGRAKPDLDPDYQN